MSVSRQQGAGVTHLGMVLAPSRTGAMGWPTLRPEIEAIDCLSIGWWAWRRGRWEILERSMGGRNVFEVGDRSVDPAK